MRILALSLAMLVLLLMNTAGGDEGSAAGVGPLDRIVEQKRDFYNRHFKEIQFVFLQGGENWTDDIDILNLLLGYLPSNLCYEHPSDLRQELMDVSINHLVNMLRNQIPFASLFRADKPLGWRENVCVISLDPAAVAGNDVVATHFMFELDTAVVEQLPAAERLPSQEFLHFLIDHEIFHCLDALYNGPQPMSHQELWGQYYNFRRENGADAFAFAINIKQQGKHSGFMQAMKDYRGAAIYGGDPDHWTYDAIRQVEQMPIAELQRATVQDMLHRASEIRDSVAGDYEGYLQYRTTAFDAMRRLHAEEGGELSEFQPDVDPELLQRLMAISSSILQSKPYLKQ